jgi:hypothetical protein
MEPATALATQHIGLNEDALGVTQARLGGAAAVHVDHGPAEDAAGGVAGQGDVCPPDALRTGHGAAGLLEASVADEDTKVTVGSGRQQVDVADVPASQRHGRSTCFRGGHLMDNLLASAAAEPGSRPPGHAGPDAKGRGAAIRGQTADNGEAGHDAK